MRQTTSGQRVDTPNGQARTQRGTAAKHPTDSPHSFGSNKTKSRANQRGQQFVKKSSFRQSRFGINSQCAAVGLSQMLKALHLFG